MRARAPLSVPLAKFNVANGRCTAWPTLDCNTNDTTYSVARSSLPKGKAVLQRTMGFPSPMKTKYENLRDYLLSLLLLIFYNSAHSRIAPDSVLDRGHCQAL